MITAEVAAVLAVMALPLALAFVPGRIAVFPNGPTPVAAFRTNAGGNGVVATLAGAVAGNVGIGSFLAIFLFADESPVIAASIVGAYSLGLVACALLAPRIRARSRAVGAVGLVDLLFGAASGSAGSRSRMAIWLPVAFVFVLRSAVQVGALGVIAADAFGLGINAAIVLSVVLLGGYLVVGGYRAAVATDVAQALILLAAIVLAAIGVSRMQPSETPFLELGSHGPALLVGIWLLLPWSAVLAVDNWQRVTIARSDRVAVGSYLAAAVICGAIFAVIALAGDRAPDGAAMRTSFIALMPEGFGWVVSAMLVACIMSSVDTFVMPLAASLGPSVGLRRMRFVIVALLAATAVCAIALGDIIATVITAFNGLAVFLPAALGALFGPPRPPLAAPASMSAGLATALLFMAIDPDAAALVGFICALAVYVAVVRRHAGRTIPTPNAAVQTS